LTLKRPCRRNAEQREREKAASKESCDPLFHGWAVGEYLATSMEVGIDEGRRIGPPAQPFYHEASAFTPEVARPYFGIHSRATRCASAN
jgi:hypothetical protein